MAALKAALADLKSSESINYAATAAEHGCDETTLRRRHQGKQVSRQDAAFECRSLLSKQQERDLISYINKLTARGLPPITLMVWNFAQDLAKKPPSKNWVYKFIRRCSNELASGWLRSVDINRKKTDNIHRYKFYFKLIS